MKTKRAPAAYHGPSWRARAGALADELAGPRPPWSAMRVDSEYRALEAVLLYRPGAELRAIRDPDSAQHLARLDARKLAAEIDALARAYRRAGIAVHFVDRDAFGPVAHYNLVFARDLFVNTRAGALVSRMASRVRAGEEKYAALALARLSVPIAGTISARGVLEGADALWLDRATVLCGIGARTNAEGFRQLAAQLRLQGVRCVPVRLPKGVQHLLGILQLVDRDLAVVRAEKIPPALERLLRKRGFRLVCLNEQEEVTAGQGMNFVTVRPRTIVMAAGCPTLKRAYAAAGIKVAAEVAVPELLKGAGGIACATGILAREVARR